MVPAVAVLPLRAYFYKTACAQCPQKWDIGVKNASKCARCPRFGDIRHTGLDHSSLMMLFHQEKPILALSPCIFSSLQSFLMS